MLISVTSCPCCKCVLLPVQLLDFDLKTVVSEVVTKTALMSQGVMPIHLAVYSNCQKLTMSMLAHGADINAKSKKVRIDRKSCLRRLS